ncbi:hypothetical protein Tco_0194459 [Tanacetum coccineum]
MWNLIQNGPYKRPMIPDADGVVNLNGTVKQVLEPLSKMTEGNDAAIRLFSVFFHEMIKYGKGKCSVYNYNERGHYASDCQETRVCDAKYFKRTNICLDMERWMPEATSTTNENYFMLDTSYVEKTMEDLIGTTSVHEQMRHEKRKTIIQTSDDDQIDSNIIFDDPYVENNGGTSDHDLNDHDEYHKIQMLAYDVQRGS